MSNQNILNVAFYRFVELADLPELKFTLKQASLRLDLRGSILVSAEGINAFIAGPEASVRNFLALLEALPPFKGSALPLDIKESWTTHVPFKRMLVKIKNEIIAMGMPDIQPARRSGRRLAPKELKQWLDERREVTLLDTRNDYEIEHGTFDGALELNLKTFRQFPEKLKKAAASLKDKPVVMFCTGGIRCEKATALAMEYGFSNVWQLDGGILKYFEETDGSHYKGDCFVFDGRTAVDVHLSGAVDRQTRQKMSNITLHSYRRCPFAIRVRMVLEEKGIPYRVIEEDLSNFSEELLKLHPQGRVPLLIHNELVIWESSIITEYLDDQFREPRLMPGAAEKKVKIRLWTHWCNEIFKPDLDLWKYKKKDMSETDRADLQSRMEGHLFKLVSPLKNHSFLMGEELTLADIHVFPFYRQLGRIHPEFPGKERFKLVDAWLEKITSRPGFARVMGS